MARQGIRRTGVLLVSATLLASGCQGGGGGGAKDKPAAGRLSVVPANGAGDVRPDQPVVVTASGEKITSVTVTAAGKPAEGQLSADGATWRTKWTLAPDTQYQVNARTDKGTTVTSSFTTLKP